MSHLFHYIPLSTRGRRKTGKRLKQAPPLKSHFRPKVSVMRSSKQLVAAASGFLSFLIYCCNHFAKEDLVFGFCFIFNFLFIFFLLIF